MTEREEVGREGRRQEEREGRGKSGGRSEGWWLHTKTPSLRALPYSWSRTKLGNKSL